MDIHKLIKELRLQNNYSINELATKLDISRQAIYKWENGLAEPSISHVTKLSNLFNITPNCVLNGISQPTVEPSKMSTLELKEQLFEATSISAIRNIMTSFINSYGLKYFIYRQMFRGDLSAIPYATIISNIPQSWIKKYRQLEYASYDPSWKYMINSVLPVTSDYFFAEAKKINDPETMKFFKDLFENIAPYIVAFPCHGSCCFAHLNVAVENNTKEYRDRINNELEPLILAAHYLYAAVHNNKNLKADEGDDLTSKEVSALKLLVNGKSIKQISEELYISIAAVNSRLERAKIKLNANNRDQLVFRAASMNVITQNVDRAQGYVKNLDMPIPCIAESIAQ